MSDHSPRLSQPAEGGLLVYPPAWYLNLVELRSRASKGGGPNTGMQSVWSVSPAIADTEKTDEVRLLALALEIIRPPVCDKLPYHRQAHILGLDVLEVREYLQDKFGEIGIRSSVATLIVEDEAAVALDLARLVRQAGHQVCGTAAHLGQAVAVAGRTHPMLVLADVQLRDGPEAGIDAVREIRRLGETAAVFVTAYPERVRHAESESLVVSKPFLAKDVQTAMWRALFRHGFVTCS